jgi:hypothetical protein
MVVGQPALRPALHHGERSPCRGGQPAQIAFVPVRQRSRGSARWWRRPAPRRPRTRDPTCWVGLADEEHFAVAGHDPAVELAVDGTVELELDHGGWFSSSWVPGGAHQRRVIRGRRAGCSQPNLSIVIILMSKLFTYPIRRPIHRYKPIIPARHLLSPAQADPRSTSSGLAAQPLPLRRRRGRARLRARRAAGVA